MSLTKQFLKSKPFTLPASIVGEAKSVVLLGDFNNWDRDKGVILKKGKDGSFKASLELETGKEYEYRFLLDESRWENDDLADKYIQTSYGVENSVVSVIV